jgi:TrwC relaxase
MLSIGKLTAAQGFDYLLRGVAHGAEDYYARDEQVGEAPGRWVGSSEALLGLAGEVRDEAFRAVYGDHADPRSGETLGRTRRVYRSVSERLAEARTHRREVRAVVVGLRAFRCRLRACAIRSILASGSSASVSGGPGAARVAARTSSGVMDTARPFRCPGSSRVGVRFGGRAEPVRPSGMFAVAGEAAGGWRSPVRAIASAARTRGSARRGRRRGAVRRGSRPGREHGLGGEPLPVLGEEPGRTGRSMSGS